MKKRMTRIAVDEVSGVDRAANRRNIWLIRKADDAPPTKSEGDLGDFPATDYAYTPDPESPTTWKLRLTAEPGGEPDAGTVGAAVAALGKGFRGQKVDIPAEDLPKVKAKVLSAWKKLHPDAEEDDVPDAIKPESKLKKALDAIAQTFRDGLAAVTELTPTAKDEGAATCTAEHCGTACCQGTVCGTSCCQGTICGESCCLAQHDFAALAAATAARAARWKLSDDMWPLWDALRDCTMASMLDANVADPRAAVAEHLQQFLDHLQEQGMLTKPVAQAVIKRYNDLAAAEPVFKVGAKVAAHRMAMLKQMQQILDTLMEDLQPAEPEGEEAPAIKKEESTMAEGANAGPQTTAAAPETISKAELEAISKRLETLESVNKALEARAENAETLAKAEVNRRVTAEYVTKCEREMPHITGTTADELGPVLKEAQEKLSEGAYATIEKALRASSEAISKGNLFSELGRSGHGNAGNAAQQVDQQAEAVAKAEGIPFADAQARVFAQDPQLYARYRREATVVANSRGQ